MNKAVKSIIYTFLISLSYNSYAEVNLSGRLNIQAGVDYSLARDKFDNDSDTISPFGKFVGLSYTEIEIAEGVSLDFNGGYRDLDETVLSDQDELTINADLYFSPDDLLFDDLVPSEGWTKAINFSFADKNGETDDTKSYDIGGSGIFYHSIENSKYNLRITPGIFVRDSDRSYEKGVTGHLDFQFRRLNQDDIDTTYCKKWNLCAHGYERISPRIYIAKKIDSDEDADSPLNASLQFSWRWWRRLGEDLNFVNLQIVAGVDWIDNFEGTNDDLTSRFVMGTLYWNFDNSDQGGGTGRGSRGNWRRP